VAPKVPGGYIMFYKDVYDQQELKTRGLVWAGVSLPYNPNLIEKANYLRKNLTKAEKKMWYQFLSKSEFKFLRQKVIDHYIVDFYCAKLRLVIEIDGSQHYSIDGLEYDEVRTDVLSEYGITVLRFSNLDVLDNFAFVCYSINNYFQKNTPLNKGGGTEGAGGLIVSDI